MEVKKAPPETQTLSSLRRRVGFCLGIKLVDDHSAAVIIRKKELLFLGLGPDGMLCMLGRS